MSKHDVRPEHTTSSTLLPPPVAEWMPLDALVQEWADFARLPQAMSALSLELVGDAFLACSYELCAHKEYILFQQGYHRDRPRILLRGLEECITQLSEACARWSSVLYWLGHLDDEPDDVLAVVCRLTEATRSQQRRVERLLLRVQEEQVAALHRQEGTRT
jgi:hypothetical protein